MPSNKSNKIQHNRAGIPAEAGGGVTKRGQPSRSRSARVAMAAPRGDAGMDRGFAENRKQKAEIAMLKKELNFLKKEMKARGDAHNAEEDTSAEKADGVDQANPTTSANNMPAGMPPNPLMAWNGMTGAQLSQGDRPQFGVVMMPMMYPMMPPAGSVRTGATSAMSYPWMF